MSNKSHSDDASTDATLARVVRIARRTVQAIVDPDAADDIAQDVAISCWDRMERGVWRVTPQTLAPHVRRVARQRAVDALRRRQRRTERDAEHGREVAEGAHAWMRPDVEAESQELALLHERLLALLPVASRRVYIMVREDGSSYAEVATALGVSRSAVSRSVVRAQKRMRKELNRCDITAPREGQRSVNPSSQRQTHD